MLEERDPDLDGEGDIKMTDSREEQWRDIADYDKNSSIIHAIGWDVYMNQKNKLTKK